MRIECIEPRSEPSKRRGLNLKKKNRNFPSSRMPQASTTITFTFSWLIARPTKPSCLPTAAALERWNRDLVSHPTFAHLRMFPCTRRDRAQDQCDPAVLLARRARVVSLGNYASKDQYVHASGAKQDRADD